MKKIISIICAAMMFMSMQSFSSAENSENSHIIGDWVYDNATDEIIGYCGNGGDVVVPSGTVVNQKFAMDRHGLLSDKYGSVPVNNLTVSENVVINSRFFRAYKNYVNVVFENSEEQVIGSLDFCDNTELISITLPKGTKSISNEEFRNCGRMQKVKNTADIKSIGTSAFWECSSLKVFDFPAVESVGEYAFYMCTGMEEMTIPNSLSKIGEAAFLKCNGVRRLTIGGRVDYTKIGYLNSLEEVNYLDGGNLDLLAKYFGGTAWSERYFNNKGEFAIENGHLQKYTGNSKNPVIPDTVKYIDDYAFYSTHITSVTIPASVVSIGENAFGRCKALKSVEIPYSVTKIGEQAFGSCKSLEKLTILGTPYIEKMAFCNTALKKNSMNIKSGFTYEGIVENQQYEYDPLIYYYPDFDGSQIALSGDCFLVPVRVPPNLDVVIIGLTDDEKLEFEVELSPQKSENPKPSPSPKTTASPSLSPTPQITALPTVSPTVSPSPTQIPRELEVTALDEIEIRIDGKAINFPDARPFIDENDRTLVPVRALSEMLGAKVDWNEKTQTVTISGDNIVKIVIGSDLMKVNGEDKKMDTTAVISDDRTFIPIRFAAEGLGMRVVWNTQR